MSTYETTDHPVTRSLLRGLFATCIQRLVDYRLHKARRRAMIYLSHYDSHMLRDIGIDPRDVEDALNEALAAASPHPPHGRSLNVQSAGLTRRPAAPARLSAARVSRLPAARRGRLRA